SNECSSSKTEQLPLGQVTKHLGFYPRKVTGYGDICRQTKTSLLLVGIEYTFGQRACLKECKAQQHRIAHHAPYGSDDFTRNRDGLDQHCIDAHTNDNQEALESKSEQRPYIVLSNLALFSVGK